MRIGIVSNPIKDTNFATAIRTADILFALGATPLIDADDGLSTHAVATHVVR
ncbi:MAG: hypothetical protein GX153_04430, partial [Clostridiaceae bacterium]|nr:hypothetical protein [Clostridiaceae bacterium]